MSHEMRACARINKTEINSISHTDYKSIGQSKGTDKSWKNSLDGVACAYIPGGELRPDDYASFPKDRKSFLPELDKNCIIPT